MDDECRCELCRMQDDHRVSRERTPAVPTCSHPLYGSGDPYRCTDANCPVHGDRNRLRGATR